MFIYQHIKVADIKKTIYKAIHSIRDEIKTQRIAAFEASGTFEALRFAAKEKIADGMMESLDSKQGTSLGEDKAPEGKAHQTSEPSNNALKAVQVK